MTVERNNPAEAQRRAELLKDVEARTKRFAPVPDGFDILSAGPEELARYGLPPRPDGDARPVAYAFWREMFSPPLNFAVAKFSLQPDPSELRPRISGNLSRRQRSLNWSGAYVTPNNGCMFTEIHGKWLVPAPRSPASGSSGGPPDDYRSSTWIGLDGQRRYLDSSLPQIGTAQFAEVKGGTDVPSTSVWWQWWLRDAHNEPVYLNLKVDPGDFVMASLTVTAADWVKLSIMNRSTGDSITPFDAYAPTAPTPLRVSGATAEWVTERPTVLEQETLYDLADYNTVVFFECIAGMARGPGLPIVADHIDGARFINMFKVEYANPSRTVDISDARRAGERAVATLYRR